MGALFGYLNNPFLRDRRERRPDAQPRSPISRTRQTLTVRVRQALPADTYLEADYRRYIDDWQVHSNTLALGPVASLHPQAP